MYKRPNKLSPVQVFQLFCLESYRSAKGISGTNALSDFRRAGVFSFLASGFEVLHTQSKNYLVAEITEFINRRNATLSRKY
ncbi:MAG: DUF3791 domain-containing protein [Draconibacterium sp.]